MLSKHTSAGLKYLGMLNMRVSAHRVSNFQVLALTGHIRNFKSIVFFHFLQKERHPNQTQAQNFTYQLSEMCIYTLKSVSTAGTYLRLELHNLKLLRELVELLVNIHHPNRCVGRLPSLWVYSLLITVKITSYLSSESARKLFHLSFEKAPNLHFHVGEGTWSAQCF